MSVSWQKLKLSHDQDQIIFENVLADIKIMLIIRDSRQF